MNDEKTERRECNITIVTQRNMRRTFKKSCAVIMAAAMLIGVAPTGSVADAAPKAKKIVLNAKTKKLNVGQKFTLKVKKITPSKAKKNVTWKTSKKSVATVSSKGLVKAVKAGTAVITATAKSNKKVKAKCTVKVSAATTVTATPTAAPTATATAAAPVATATATVAPTATPKPTAKPTATPFVLPEKSLKESTDLYNVGTVINYDKTQDKSFGELAKQQFDVVSFENEMKGYSLIDTGASQSAVKEKNDEKVIACNFDRADEMVKWCIDKGLKVRGHVLFWEESMAKGIFYKGYDESGELVDAETLKARMESYADQVINHFEKEFPGTVIAWDVVNEAINADSAAEKDETTGLYLNKGGNFYKILGGEYIKYAFEYAKKAVAKSGASINLFYNDFNTFQSPKTDRIVSLIKYLNADENNKLLDCMGMEGYVLTYWPSASDVEKAMNKFAGLGVKVGINELCVRLSPQYSSDGKQVTDADITAHAQKCEDMFTVYCKFAKSHPDTLTNVSIWALTDRPDLMAEADKPEGERHYDYGVYGTHSGLFTAGYTTKTAFDKVIAVLEANK